MAANSTNDRLLTAVKEKRSLELVNECLKYTSLGLGSGLDWAGNTALHHAVTNGDFEIVKSLIRHGANVNSYNKFKKTPLHLACQSGNECIASFLIENGSDINAKDMLKMTPVLWCVEREHENLVILLCGRTDLDLNNVDKFARTCFDISLSKNNDFIKRILSNFKQNSIINEKNFLTNLSQGKNEDALKAKECFGFGLKEFKLPANTNYNMLILDEDDDDESMSTYENESKKKRFSFSPIQSVEETIFWLKKHSNSNSNEYLLNKNCELSLTEAGKLVLEYLNKMDPIRDEQNMLIRLAQKMEDEQKEASIEVNSSNINQSEKSNCFSLNTNTNEVNDDFGFGKNLDDWFIDNINFDNDVNEFF